MQKESQDKQNNNEGFSLLELSVVIGVMATTMAISIPVYQSLQDRSMIEAAKKSILNMRTECLIRNSLNSNTSFSNAMLRGYTLSTYTGNCDELLAVADNNEKHPNFAYDFITNKFTCSYKNAEATPFPECKKINPTESVAKNESIGLAQKRDALVDKIPSEEAATLAKANEENDNDKPTCDPRTGILPTGKGLASLGAITPCPGSTFEWYESRGINPDRIPRNIPLPNTKEEYDALIEKIEIDEEEKRIIEENKRIAKENKYKSMLEKEALGTRYCWKRYVRPGRVYTGAIDPNECGSGAKIGDPGILTRAEFDDLEKARQALNKK